MFKKTVEDLSINVETFSLTSQLIYYAFEYFFKI